MAIRIALHKFIKGLRDKGTTIILSTHDMAEAETMADRVAILLQGQRTPRELTAAGQGLTKISVRTMGKSLAGANFPGVVQQAVHQEYRIYFAMSPVP